MNYSAKLRKTCKLYHADVLVLEKEVEPGVLPPGSKLISLHHLAHLLKPIKHLDESLRVKIQRIGKEPEQGVGYLEDGTMIVVNGGGSHIGEEVSAWIISTKHSSSGRIIFCNLLGKSDSGHKRSTRSTQQLIEV